MALRYTFDGREGSLDEAAEYMASTYGFADYLYDYDDRDFKEADWAWEWLHGFMAVNAKAGVIPSLYDVRWAFFKMRLEDSYCDKDMDLLGVVCLGDDEEAEEDEGEPEDMAYERMKDREIDFPEERD